jgi:hypothetical protein
VRLELRGSGANPRGSPQALIGWLFSTELDGNRTMRLDRPIVLAVVFGSLAFGCRREQPAPAAGASPSASAAVDPLPAVEAAATRLKTELRAKLQTAMKDGGPAKAIDVCATEAPLLYSKIAKETGVKVGRASLRLRNPADAPPAWVAEWLKAQGERKAEGVEGVRAVVDAGGGKKSARVLQPIAIEAPCLACHGGATKIAADVKDALSARYPQDLATDYALGDLRGAVWAERAVE